MTTYYQAEAYAVREIVVQDDGFNEYKRAWVFETISDACTFARKMTEGMDEHKAMQVIQQRKRNRVNARMRNQAMRDIGMKKTKYGWE